MPWFRSAAMLSVIAAALAVGETAWAQAEPALPAYTLPEALAYARDHQPQIRSALAEAHARLAEAKVPRARWYPQLGATAQIFAATSNQTTGSYLNVPETDLPRIGGTRATSSTDWAPRASTLAALTLDQEVYDFGRIAAQSAIADALAEQATANAELLGLDVQLAVEEAFHAVLAAKEVQRDTEEAYRRTLTHRDYSQAAVKNGLRPPIELTRAQADLAQLEVRRIRAQAGLRAARAALAASIGESKLEVDAREPSAAGAAPAFDEALKLAQARNPVIAAQLARVKAEESRARAILHDLYPNLFATATLSGRAGGALPSSGLDVDVPYGQGFLPDIGNWHVGLVLQWNLFDMTVLRRREAARARVEAAQADLDALRTQVTLVAERAYLDLDASTRALPGLEETVRAAQANQAQAEARFRAGLGTSVELADAEALLTNAQLELAIGRFAIARARAALGRAIGEKILQISPGR